MTARLSTQEELDAIQERVERALPKLPRYHADVIRLLILEDIPLLREHIEALEEADKLLREAYAGKVNIILCAIIDLDHGRVDTARDLLKASLNPQPEASEDE